MVTSSKFITALLTLTLFMLISCSSEEDPLLIPSERTDISITGDLEMTSFQQNSSYDLIRFSYFGPSATRIDYIIKLNDGLDLIIRVFDEVNATPWLQVGQPYNIYPGQDLEDKQQYAIAEIHTTSNEPRYSSNSGAIAPQGTLLDVFKVLENDGELMQCRIRDMKLFHYIDASRTIDINGTFVAEVNF